MRKREDVKGEIFELFGQRKRVRQQSPKKGKPKSASIENRETQKEKITTINQTIRGNNNVQAGGDINLSSASPPVIKILPPPLSIGADPLLKLRIITIFNKIGEARESRVGKRAYPVMYRNFKTDFKIKNAAWTIIWTWPQSCAGAIITYLEDKYANTIQGRIEGAAKKEGYLHTRPHLYRIEKELLENIGLDMKSPQIRELLRTYFGVTTHTKLTHLQHWQLVCHIEHIVKQWISENT